MEFISTEIDVLFDALDALESKASNDVLTGGLMSLIFSKGKEQADEVGNDLMNKLGDVKHEQRHLKEQIILLKAKLLQARDAQAVQDGLDYLRSGE